MRKGSWRLVVPSIVVALCVTRVPVPVATQLVPSAHARTVTAAHPRPPQFIVVSFDGGGWPKKWRFWRSVARRSHATFTFFLSGVYDLSGADRMRYSPPHRPQGASDIGFSSHATIAQRLVQLRAAHREGHELGTHFNGHFCGPSGVGSWNADDWNSELDQFFSFVPYGPNVVRGARTPCLEGNKPVLRKVLAKRGFLYDASDVEPRPMWPTKIDGIWEFATPFVPAADGRGDVALMDYEFFFRDSRALDAPVGERPAFRKNALDTMRAAFKHSYDGPRTPLYFVNHFNEWSGGIYADAMASFAEEVCVKPQVRCVSFAQLVRWLDAHPSSSP